MMMKYKRALEPRHNVSATTLISDGSQEEQSSLNRYESHLIDDLLCLLS